MKSISESSMTSSSSMIPLTLMFSKSEYSMGLSTGSQLACSFLTRSNTSSTCSSVIDTGSRSILISSVLPSTTMGSNGTVALYCVGSIPKSSMWGSANADMSLSLRA